ncbi:MAG: hypothetical protein R3Y23_00350 [Bacillota bacterium]
MFTKIKEKIAGKKMKVEKISNPEINAYLSQFNCASCHNHCALSNIKCGRGLAQRDAKVSEYTSLN